MIDETRFLKEGTHSAGVGRQYGGTAGRIENCQIGVFLAYASRSGRALIDRELYLPEQWASDVARRAEARIPEAARFATKPQLARLMIERAITAGVPFAWITGDAVYGNNRQLRVWIEQQELHHILAVAGNQHIWKREFTQTTAQQLAQTIEPQDWQTLIVKFKKTR